MLTHAVLPPELEPAHQVGAGGGIASGDDAAKPGPRPQQCKVKKGTTIVDDGGCGCVVARPSRTPPAIPVLVIGLGGLVFLRARRRR